ncbi:MAG TPA: phosphopantetheine-binding protein [Candidatus Dormibacteraeota bacterium]|nr:phosphopantetheine-binding protein [Candidatus Dormibacteraeota bacterium]
MTEAHVKAAVSEVLHRIAPEADLDQLDAQDDLTRALDIDSFDFLNLLEGIHAKLGVDVPEADYGRVRTLSALVAYLAARTR